MNRLAQKKKVCALIPARRKSVRFPGKALKQIDGKMCIRDSAYTFASVSGPPFMCFDDAGVQGRAGRVAAYLPGLEA